MSLFTKEILCNKCGLTQSKRDVKIIDTKQDGRNKLGKKIKVCNRCFELEMRNTIKDNLYKAVLVYPMKNSNSYVYYNFNEILCDSRNQLLVDDLQPFLPNEDTVCECCGDFAQYAWCSPEIFDNDPWNWRVSGKKFKIQYLCKECASNAVLNYIHNNEINLQYFYPQISGTGFFIPWDV